MFMHVDKNMAAIKVNQKMYKPLFYVDRLKLARSSWLVLMLEIT